MGTAPQPGEINGARLRTAPLKNEAQCGAVYHEGQK